MKDTLKIASDISFPIDFVTQTVAILAKRRSGKSYTMRRIAEQLLHKGQQVVLVDPKGDQWGIRSSADGKKPGYPVVIFGGEHGDVPLEVGAGELVAKLVVEERVSILLDLSLFRKHEVATFMTAFLENLYRLKAQEKYRTPVMLIIDEADAIAPQKPQKGEERMLGAAEDIVRRGGQRGLGCVLVTQRSAVLNKNVLTQAEVLIVLRTIAPQDLAAMKAWIDLHGTSEQGKILMESLPSLPIGDAWFWSPGWPTSNGIFKRSRALPIETFDSGATPKPGEKKIVPKNLADIDLEVLKGQMADTIEKAKADNPKELKKRIADLEAQLKKGVLATPDAIELAVKEAERRKDIEFMAERDEFIKHMSTMFKVIQQVGEVVKDIKMPDLKARGERVLAERVLAERVIAYKPLFSEVKQTMVETVSVECQDIGATITNPEQRILNAVAWANSIGIDQPQNPIIAFLSGYTNHRSTGYTNPRGALAQKGLVSYPVAGTVILTDIGRKYAEGPGVIPVESELHERILERLTGPQSRILKVLLEARGEPIQNEQIAEAAGYSNVRSTGYTNPRGDLKSYGLIEYTPQGVRAASFLFL